MRIHCLLVPATVKPWSHSSQNLLAIILRRLALLSVYKVPPMSKFREVIDLGLRLLRCCKSKMDSLLDII